ncbi:MAG TPA: hypothetical protein VGB73_16865 [Pyrinomonadaceae bacterium]|jgi:hypothetical protein
MSSKRETGARRTRSLRLIFAYEGGSVRLVGRQSVEMIPPPSDSLAGREGETGFWYELRDSQGRALYRRLMQNPIQYSTEVLSNDPMRPVERRDVQEPRGVFVLISPDIEEAQTLALFSAPSERNELGRSSRIIGEFDLKQDAGGKEETR